MPCSDGIPYESRKPVYRIANPSQELANARDELSRKTKRCNELEAELDFVREQLLRFMDDYPDFPVDGRIKIGLRARQIDHRQKDLERLEQRFLGERDAEHLKAVWSATPSQPLADQLGFDPDDY